ncbi:hypothetical protein CMV30_10275 [Nibricoccus aquaticus]|uniref:Restriction system protein Mrr-like N-terminal domain-containing protein n=2 Tax=Nibricoccus aquaticus TaxID=2576891 RepID=A0A290QG47_9BACT|nr:hypothetical protein CMV30_10275 [Nibricoccus aquaticus]
MILVMQALAELRGSNTKQEVIGHIIQTGYYEVTRHDLPPYDGQNESRYHTLLAWARKDCVELEYLLGHERDAWALSRNGDRAILKARELFGKNEWDVRRCYLWTPKFKLLMLPSYLPSPKDAKRPEDILDAL